MNSIILALIASALCLAQPLTFTPFQKTGTYETGERAGWTVTGPADTKLAYAIKKDNWKVIKTGTLDLAAGSATIEATLQEPAMLYVDVVGGSKIVHLGAAIAPTKLQPAAPRPADFDAFWDAKLKALAAVPINPVLTPLKTDQPGVELYTIKLDSLGSHVQGYLAKPAGEGKFPALMMYQWAGVYKLNPEAAVKRAAEGWLVFNVSAHDLPPDSKDGVGDDYWLQGISSRETAYFLGMYLRDARAVDYIVTRPDWDGRTIVATGTSQGGHQSLVAAALCPRITAVVVNEPSGADLNAELHGRKGGFPTWPAENARAMEAALYFDTINFAPRIKAPVTAAIGFIDTVCPPTGIWTAINQLPGRKEVIPMIESDHNNLTPEKQGAWDTRSKELLDALRTDGAAR